MLRRVLFVFVMLWGAASSAQSDKGIAVKIVNSQKLPLPAASVELLKTDSSLIKISLTDSSGAVYFHNAGLPDYLLRVSMTNHLPVIIPIADNGQVQTVVLFEKTLAEVTVVGRKPFIEQKANKTVVNVEAGITNAGITLMELLEKLPGITLDREGNISLKGRDKTAVMIDGKLTYLEGDELATLLNAIGTGEVSQIELVDNPSAKDDARGSGGIVNIKTKKGLQSGFNGTLNLNYTQGFYAKTNNSVLLNHRWSRANLFVNYSHNRREDFTRVEALRTYYKNDGSISSFLEQPGFLNIRSTVNNLRTGVDYSFSNSTSVGLTFAGILRNSTNEGNASAYWMKTSGQTDSIIHTTNSNERDFRNGQASINFRHRFSATAELTADVDLLGYRIREDLNVQNEGPGYTETYRATVPSEYRIVTGKIDYSGQFGTVRFEGGIKSSQVNTDNQADYDYSSSNGAPWRRDYGKSNHFLYRENIYAMYADAQTKLSRWTLQGGLRYEATDYDAKQLVKDSAFSRRYNSLFPTLSVSFEKDSFNTFSLSAGRRIDRPQFQWLNPFTVISNKYTYQTGNPYFRPQFTWNVGLNHSYKNLLLTGLSYSLTTDYFSQIFRTDPNGIVTFTQGNFGRRQIFGASVGLQLMPKKWWSLLLQTQLNRKYMEGVIDNVNTSARITQYTINLTNQFRLRNGWSAEINGLYNSASQVDIQEVLDPSGQLSLGLAKTVWKNRGTLKLSVRDVLFTAWYKGFSQFTQATEYFKVMRDSRVAALTFTWRFGNAYKTAKRSEGSADDEVQRLGNE